jgi:hypothetical protein
MLDNQTRRELLSKARQSGFPGSILDVFAAYEQGRDLVAEFQQQKEQQQTQQMSDQAAQQSGMQMPQQMQQEQPQQGPPPPQGPPPGLPQGSRIPQPQSPNTGLVNSNEAEGTGIASNASGKVGSQEILAMGGFREDEYNKFSSHFPFSKQQRGTIAHNATVEHPDLTMVQGKKYVFGGLKYGGGGMQKDPPDMPFGLPLKEQNIYTLPEYNQPKNPKTGEILPDPQRPNLGMGTGATEYKMTAGFEDGDVDIPTIVAGQYIGQRGAEDRYRLTGERFKTMADPGAYSKFYEQTGRLGLMQEKRKGGFKYENGGPGDPPVIPANPAADQPFTQHYQDNAAAFNAADSAARSYMTDWFTKRASAAEYPQHKESATAMADYLQKSGRGVYVPEGTAPEDASPEVKNEAFGAQFDRKGKSLGDAVGFANTADYRLRPADSNTAAGKILLDNKNANAPFEYPAEDEGGEILSTGTPLTYNTAYYRGEYGKQPTTQLEEQLHLASQYGEYMSPNHAKSFGKVSAGEDIKGLGNTGINQKNIKAMGYPDIMDKTSLKYFGDVQEFYPRLMSARRTFGINPTLKYTDTQMAEYLDKGFENLKHDYGIRYKNGYIKPDDNNPDLIYKEAGQMDHLMEFYKQLGYPTPAAGFTKGASEDEIKLQKEAAAKKFRMSNEILAMQKKGDASSVEYPPLVSRYGGYRTRR